MVKICDFDREILTLEQTSSRLHPIAGRWDAAKEIGRPKIAGWLSANRRRLGQRARRDRTVQLREALEIEVPQMAANRFP